MKVPSKIPLIDFKNCPFRFDSTNEFRFKTRRAKHFFSGYLLTSSGHLSRYITAKLYSSGVVNLKKTTRLDNYHIL